MQPRPVAGGVCGNGIGLEKVSRLRMMKSVCGGVGDGVDTLSLPTLFPTQLTAFFKYFLPGFTWIAILSVGSSVGNKKKGSQTEVCNPLI